MKKPLLTAALIAFVTAGCASNNSLPEPAAKPDPIHLGMTKEEVLKALGHKPKTIQTSPRGELWHYDNVELAAIPFNFGFRPEFKNYIFDEKGILIDFNTTQPAR